MNFVVQKTICEHFEQVLQNCKKWTPNSAHCSVIAIVLDRNYKYGLRFVRYQLVTKVSWY